MRHALLFVLLPAVASATVAAACTDSSPPAETSPDAGDTTAIPPGTEPTGESTPSGPAGTGLATGLPCDVQAVIENRCIACHSGDTPPPLLDYDDLARKSQKDPSKSMAQAALDLMNASAMPPPPAVPPEDDEIAAFEDWVKAGTPKNPKACTDPPPKEAPDAGAKSDAAPADGGGGGGVKCTSGKMWNQGDNGSPLMHPGAACNACHQAKGGPNLRIAGTVFPTLHEPNDCIGSAPPPQLTVTVTDSRKPVPRTITMQVNASGNFFTRERFTPPLKAAVSDGAKTRAMVGTVSSGDCNSCHTVAGLNGAPGRIMAP